MHAVIELAFLGTASAPFLVCFFTQCLLALALFPRRLRDLHSSLFRLDNMLARILVCALIMSLASASPGDPSERSSAKRARTQVVFEPCPTNTNELQACAANQHACAGHDGAVEVRSASHRASRPAHTM